MVSPGTEDFEGGTELVVAGFKETERPEALFDPPPLDESDPLKFEVAPDASL